MLQNVPQVSLSNHDYTGFGKASSWEVKSHCHHILQGNMFLPWFVIVDDDPDRLLSPPFKVTFPFPLHPMLFERKSLCIAYTAKNRDYTPFL